MASLPQTATLSNPATLVATGFGIGLLPRAPGTWGSLAALPVGWAIVHFLGVIGLALAVAVVFAVGWWAAQTVSQQGDDADPAAVVIDEVVGQWIVLLATPPEPLLYGLAFVAFRLFDIAKPFPVSWAERRFAGGLGIMADDVLAAGYAVAVVLAVRWWLG
ncbi:MAG: phosphatidylglycerophosphatase A [Rhodospirillales bacterium]|nr:MAG: phosphatidylglycerophosphatase A [Rhodospirillales bacterium]